jgi:hypothetical protein
MSALTPGGYGIGLSHPINQTFWWWFSTSVAHRHRLNGLICYQHPPTAGLSQLTVAIGGPHGPFTFATSGEGSNEAGRASFSILKARNKPAIQS